MADIEMKTEPLAAPTDEPAIQAAAGEGGAYDLIRRRMQTAASQLLAELKTLNQERRSVYGAVSTELLGSERISTANNCIPRDMTPIGAQFLFGYNVHIGLRSETELQDVFAVYAWQDEHLTSVPLDIIDDADFKRDFAELYKYYKNTTFAKFARRGAYLYMKFRVGSSVDDFKAFKWLIGDDGKLTYINNRGDHELHYPPQHEIEWQRLGRDAQRTAQHQAEGAGSGVGGQELLSIREILFISVDEGHLTFRIEDNTDSGALVAREPVEEQEQKLDDLSVEFAQLEHLLVVRVRPYREEALRYFVFNSKIGELRRVDGLAEAAILLPENHGLIFPSGSYLNDGTLQELDTRQQEMVFERRLPAPNGEDFLYVFYNRADGVYVLLNYNLIEQALAPPLVCNGFSLFDDGRLLCFRVEELAQKHHMVQTWRTPFMRDMPVATEAKDSELLKIGNRDIVRCMAECHELYSLTQKQNIYTNLFLDIARKAGDIRDAYFWLQQIGTGAIISSIDSIRTAADAAIDEYEKLQALKADTAQKFADFAAGADELFNNPYGDRADSIDAYVGLLADVRKLRGRAAAGRELPHSDTAAIKSLDDKIKEHGERIAHNCVEFLLRDDALDSYRERIQLLDDQVAQLSKAGAFREPLESLDGISTDLEMLIDVVVNLNIEDSTQSTRIVESISAQFTDINSVRSRMRARRSDLAREEGEAEFRAQINLVQQSLLNYLELADTPPRCDEYSTKLLVQIEELEARFSDFDGFIEELALKRDDVYNAFEQKKLALTEKLNKRALQLTRSAERILGGIADRLGRFTNPDEIFAYFSTDPMVAKVREISESLRNLGDSTRADDMWTRLNSQREDALRNLKDAGELFVDGPDRVRFGRQVFSVVNEIPRLSLVQREEDIHFHISGTQYYLPVHDDALAALTDLWDQEIAVENHAIYRGEYLAFNILNQIRERQLALPEDASEVPQTVQAFLQHKPADAYVKGVHDHDATLLLQKLLEMEKQAGMLAWDSRSRALAYAFWTDCAERDSMQHLNRQLMAMRAVGSVFALPRESEFIIRQLTDNIHRYRLEHDVVFEAEASEAAQYLFKILTEADERTGKARFVLNKAARSYADQFHSALAAGAKPEAFQDSIAGTDEAAMRLRIAFVWLQAQREAHDRSHSKSFAHIVDAAVYLSSAAPEQFAFETLEADTEIEGLHGLHQRITQGGLQLNYHEFQARLTQFQQTQVPRFKELQARKHELLEEHRAKLRLEKFQPQVASFFVRNQLLSRVYLPLIGENFARQIGTAGKNTRSDRSGLLLLISPPGYGKTSLIEYIAKRLGMLYLKVDGPALGHEVTSLDPNSAPNSAARAELERLNLAFAIGDNVLLYVDDIQHCNPEFLQKFIPLCDAQRRIEGVMDGQAKSFDLRGRRFAVVMAGNPYTESGSAFVIPDMLSNRADVFNLGDMSTAEREPFEMSFIENCLTSNSATRRMAQTYREDVPAFIEWAERGKREGLEFKGSYAAAEMEEIVNVIAKLLRVRDVVLKVNNAYIKSAATAEAYRTEPPFQLQGSYRDMNKIAANVLAVMTDGELDKLIENHYVNEAQTLAGDSEANLLKWREIMGVMSVAERERYKDIVQRFGDNQLFAASDDNDPLQETLRQIQSLNSGVRDIARAISDHAGDGSNSSSSS